MCRCAQMIDHMMANALGQVEQAVDDELERIENFTVRALSASPSAAHSADACQSALASTAPPPPGSPPPCPCLRARCPRRTHTGRFVRRASTARSQEDDLAKIRANRIAEMKQRAEEQQQWADNGHGVMTKITDQKMFFDVSKGSEKVRAAFAPSRHGPAHLSRAPSNLSAVGHRPLHPRLQQMGISHEGASHKPRSAPPRGALTIRAPGQQ